MAGWSNRRDHLVDLVESGEPLSGRDRRDIAAALKRTPAPAEDVRADLVNLTIDYFNLFCVGLSARAAVKQLQKDVAKYERAAWLVDSLAPGPPDSIRGTAREIFWEILSRGALPSERTLRRIHGLFWANHGLAMAQAAG